MAEFVANSRVMMFFMLVSAFYTVHRLVWCWLDGMLQFT